MASARLVPVLVMILWLLCLSAMFMIHMEVVVKDARLWQAQGYDTMDSCVSANLDSQFMFVYRGIANKRCKNMASEVSTCVGYVTSDTLFISNIRLPVYFLYIEAVVKDVRLWHT